MTPTQISNPGQAALRTFIQVIVPGLAAVNSILPSIMETINTELAKIGLVLPDWALLGANAAVLAVGALSAIISRIMAIPAVNDWLTKIGLGATPKTES